MPPTKKILAVSTSEGPIVNKSRSGLWLGELSHFVVLLHREGYTVDVVSIKGGKIPLDEKGLKMTDKLNQEFMNNPEWKDSLENSKKVCDVNVADYDGIFLAGGHGTMFDFRQSAELREKTTEFHRAGKFMFGICHGVSGFTDIKDENGEFIVKGCPITGFSNLEDQLGRVASDLPFLLETELKKNGAIYKKAWIPFTSYVVQNGKLITAQNPQSSIELAKAAIAALKKE